MLSERQRLALARSVSPREWIEKRNSRNLLQKEERKFPETVHIDGFNSVITLEVALSGSPVFVCRDGTIRDLAGLRGTYRIIDKTEDAIELILQKLILLKNAIILNRCISWLNIMPEIVDQLESVWKIQL